MHVYTHVEKSKSIEDTEFFSPFSYQQKKEWDYFMGWKLLLSLCGPW